MGEISLTDPKRFPDDDVLSEHLGKSKGAWDKFRKEVESLDPGMSLEWRYYNDGKAWLCKLTRKKKTVCWIGVCDGSFRTTFYFTAENDKEIAKLKVAKRLKDRYSKGKSYGKLKAFTIEVRGGSDLKDVREMIGYKISQN